MRMFTRIAAALSLCAAVVGVSSLVNAGGHPPPPPGDLCGCLCPDGSIVVAHAAPGQSCEDACPAIVNAFCALDM